MTRKQAPKKPSSSKNSTSSKNAKSSKTAKSSTKATKATKNTSDTSTKTAKTTASTAASNASNVSNEAYREMNRMLIASFAEIFDDATFKAAFNTANFDRVQALNWMRTSTITPARRIVERMSLKAEKRTKRVANSSIRNENDPVMEELGTQQVGQTFRAALAIHTYGVRDQRVPQAFKNTFLKRQCSIMFLNAGSYIQSVLGTGASDKPLSCRRRPTVFEVLMWLHCVNMVTDLANKKKMTLRFNYRAGNIIGYVVHRVCSAWNLLVRGIGEEPLSVQLLPYLWYRENNGCFEQVPAADGFTPASQRQSLIPAMRPIRGGAEVSDAALARTPQEDAAMRHIAFAFLYKLKQIVSDSAIYGFQTDEEVVNYPSIRALHRSNPNELPFVFVEMDDAHMEALGIQKPVPPPLEVINVDDATAAQVGEVTKIPTGLQDASLIFGPDSLGERPQPSTTARKRTMTSATSGRPKKKRKVAEDSDEEEEEVVDVSGQGTTTVKEEVELVDDVEPALSEDFDNDTQEAYARLLTAMQKTTCSFYTAPFDLTHEAHSAAQGEELEKAVQLVFADGPYNCRREQNRNNSAHDRLTDEQMINYVEKTATLLKPGGHVLIFCSAVQFGKWVRYFSTKTETEEEVDEENPEVQRKVRRRVFSVEQTPLKFIRAPGYYLSKPVGRRLTHTSMTEYAFHAWKNGISQAANLDRVDYNNGGFIPSRFPGWTDTIDNIPRLTPGEKVFTDKVSDNGRPLMLRPEQKSVAVMQTIVSQYTQPGDIVVDQFAGSGSTGRACMMLPLHRRCIMGDIDPSCAKFSMKQLVEVYARQVIDDISDINVDEGLKEAAKLFVGKMDRINALKHSKVWHVAPGHSTMQRFPPELVHFISCYYQDFSLYRHMRQLEMITWSPNWRARFNEMDVNTLLAFELSRRNLEVRPSTIPGAGNGVFTNVKIPPRTVVGHFYGLLVYENMLINQARRPVMYGEGIMSFPVKDFLKWALQLTSRTRTGEKVWIYPAPFCPMGIVNDARYKDGEEGRPTAQQLAANPERYRQNNCEFVDGSHRADRKDLREFKLVEVISLDHEIKAGSELFVDYGEGYGGFNM